MDYGCYIHPQALSIHDTLICISIRKIFPRSTRLLLTGSDMYIYYLRPCLPFVKQCLNTLPLWQVHNGMKFCFKLQIPFCLTPLKLLPQNISYSLQPKLFVCILQIKHQDNLSPLHNLLCIQNFPQRVRSRTEKI